MEAWRNFSAAQTAAAAAAAWAYDPALVSYPYGARCVRLSAIALLFANRVYWRSIDGC